MGTLDSAFRDLASTLIGVFTDEMWTLTRTPPDAYAPKTGESFPSTPVPYQVKLSPPTEYTSHEIDGTSILRGDLRAYLAAKDIDITPDPQTDTLSKGELVLKIVSVSNEPSGDQTAMYELQLRK